MSLIDVITKSKKFTKVSLNSLPTMLLNQIIDLAKRSGVLFFEVWEEEILETYVYDGVDARTINKTLYKQHYKDVETETFFAVSFQDDNKSFKKSSKGELEKITIMDLSIRDPFKWDELTHKYVWGLGWTYGLKYGNEIMVSRKKEYFNFKEIPDWLLADAYSFDNAISNISPIGLQRQYSSKHLEGYKEKR